MVLNTPKIPDFFKRRLEEGEVLTGSINQKKGDKKSAVGDGGAGTDINVTTGITTLTGSTINITEIESTQLIFFSANILISAFANSDIVSFSVKRGTTIIATTQDFDVRINATTPILLTGIDNPGEGDFTYTLTGYDDGSNPASTWYINDFSIMII